jgi:bifunctional DNase/RNase
VDETAAVAIAFRLAHRAPPQPLSQDLLDRMVSQMGGTVTSVRIDDVHEHILLSHVYVKQGHKRLGFDAKPSDAVSMALAGNARIWATKQVVSQAGISKHEIDDLRDKGGLGVGGSAPAAPTPSKKSNEVSL